MDTTDDAPPRTGYELAVTWFGTLVWSALSVPVVWALWHDSALRSSPWALFMALFPVVGLLLWFTTIRLTLGRIRFGRLVLDPDPAPGTLGGHVGGSVFVPISHRRAEDYRISLACIRSRVKKSSDGTSRSESVIWTAEGTPQVERQGRGVRVRFTFQIPEALPPTGEPSTDFHHWEFRLEGDVPGIDLDQVFPVTVKGEPAAVARLPALVAEPKKTLDRGRLGPVRVQKRGGSTVLVYPVGREWGTGVALAMFGAVFLAFPVAVISSMVGGRTPTGGFEVVLGLFALPIVLIFAVVGALILVLGLYVLLNGLTVRLSATTISSTRRILVFSRTKTADVDNIVRVEQSIGGQVGSGARARVSYRIVAHLATGGRVALGDGIRGPALVRGLASQISESTGLAVAQVSRRKWGNGGR